MKNDNLKMGNDLAKYFNKKYGIITYSGTLAIEVALLNMGLGKKSKILISSNVCYSILNIILKLEMIPVIVDPKNDLFLTENDILEVLKKTNIDCIILVHQYGIINSIGSIKKTYSNIKIIEDAAQIWDIKDKNLYPGIHSDIVVTSFGKTKPLSYGIGGGLFFNNNYINKNIDYCDNKSRENKKILLPYAYPLCNSIDLSLLIDMGNKNVREQRKNAKKYSSVLANQSLLFYLNSEEYINNAWHRFPIWIEDEKKYVKIVNYLKTTNLEYQLPHKNNLKNLPMSKDSINIDNRIKNKNFILLRTRNIKINAQLEILSKIIKQFE